MLERVDLRTIPIPELLELMNDPRVGRHLPLLSGTFDAEAAHAFLEAKAAMWREHGYGPWGFRIDGRFAGWGGLQPEQGEADFALVLAPAYWGWGRRIFEAVRAQAFGPMGLDRITAVLPPGRANRRAILRLGFRSEGTLDVQGHRFERFALSAP